MRGILQSWPRYNAKKELLLFDEMEQILQTMTIEQVQSILPSLLKRWCLCIQRGHFMVGVYGRRFKHLGDSTHSQILGYYQSNFSIITGEGNTKSIVEMSGSDTSFHWNNALEWKCSSSCFACQVYLFEIWWKRYISKRNVISISIPIPIPKSVHFESLLLYKHLQYWSFIRMIMENAFTPSLFQFNKHPSLQCILIEIQRLEIIWKRISNFEYHKAQNQDSPTYQILHI